MQRVLSYFDVRMKRYKIVVAYDGTDFCGWAPQPEMVSVTQVMQDVYYAVFRERIALVGASRTDAGVHALGQVARFHSCINVDIATMRNAWNARLPATIVIRSLEYAADDFHPHHAIQYKTYYYHFFLTRPLPFFQRYGAYFPGAFDMNRLCETLQLFVGIHDFTAFSTGNPIGDNPLCTLDSIEVKYIKSFGVWRISITGDRFLRHMVRRIVGAAFTCAQKKDSLSVAEAVAEVKHTFVTKNTNNCLLNAPAKGLLLYKVCYKS